MSRSLPNGPNSPLLDRAHLIRWCQRHVVSVVSATEQIPSLTASVGYMLSPIVV